MLTMHSNLARIHWGLRGQLDDLFVENWQKPYNWETLTLTTVLCVVSSVFFTADNVKVHFKKTKKI